MDDDLIAAHGDVPQLMPFLHLPVQSGSDAVLEAMNRGYTADDYRRVVDRAARTRGPTSPCRPTSSSASRARPTPTSTATLRLVEEVGFAQAYSFKYSARPGTPASTCAGRCRSAVKAERLQRLQDAARASGRRLQRRPASGGALPVLLERAGRHPGQLVGRSPYLQAVHVDGTRRCRDRRHARGDDHGPSSPTAWPARPWRRGYAPRRSPAPEHAWHRSPSSGAPATGSASTTTRPARSCSASTTSTSPASSRSCRSASSPAATRSSSRARSDADVRAAAAVLEDLYGQLKQRPRGRPRGGGRRARAWRPTADEDRQPGLEARAHRPPARRRRARPTRRAYHARCWSGTTWSSRWARPAPARPTSRWRRPWPCCKQRRVDRHDPLPAGGRGRRAAGLPARRPEGEGRPLPAPALRRAPGHAAGGQAAAADRERPDRDRPARLHARPHAEQRLRHPRRGAEHHARRR